MVARGDGTRRGRSSVPGRRVGTAADASAPHPRGHARGRCGRWRVSRSLGITSPRRVVILVLVVCAVALTVAVPLRNYLTQRSDLAAVQEQQQILEDQVAELERRRALQEDPQYVEAQARERLRYVRPGETPYMVQLPSEPERVVKDELADAPWYTRLWQTIVGD